uniref:Microfibril associated protein 5 n=1 Tax=Eptatretus burgeri TaxID=7764 RepID=A0A8C4N9Q1_EPTBU
MAKHLILLAASLLSTCVTADQEHVLPPDPQTHPQYPNIHVPDPAQWSQFGDRDYDYNGYEVITSYPPYATAYPDFLYGEDLGRRDYIYGTSDAAGAHQVGPAAPVEPQIDCREEQYVCTRLYSVNKPCKECIKTLCLYRSRRVYVVNKEVCIRTVCESDEIHKASLCKDQLSHP